MGYPHGLDSNLKKIVQRSLKGYIVSGRHWSNGLINTDIYELSFPCPRGLSGAPLLFQGALVGIVIASSSVGLEVFREVDRETVTEGTRTHETVATVTEVVPFGIAVRSEVYKNINLSGVSEPLATELRSVWAGVIPSNRV